MHENFDLTNIVTPVNIPAYTKLLKQSNFDQNKAVFLIKGFTEGFDLGYEGPYDVKKLSPNLKLTVGNETILWNKIMKEVRLKRFAGPFEDIPEQYRDCYIQSPIGLVPKGQRVRYTTNLPSLTSKKS